MRRAATGLLSIILLASTSFAAEDASVASGMSESEKTKVRDKLPRYDATQSDPTGASSPVSVPKAGARVGRRSGTAPRSQPPSSKSGETVKSSPATGAPDSLSLSPYIVRVAPVESDRLARPSPIKPDSNDKIDPFLSPAALQEAVVKKYLSSFDRNFLNRWTLPLFGISNFQRAKTLYDADWQAAELNGIADVLEVPGENSTEKEKKEMKILYDRVLYSGRR